VPAPSILVLVGMSLLIGCANGFSGFGPAATDHGFHTLAWVMLAIGVLSLILTVGDRSIPRVAE